MTINNINSFIDHTQLKPEATPGQIEKLCQEAIDYKFKAVCVNPVHVNLAANLLKDSEVEIASVVGFPLGASATDVKEYEAKKAVEHGASEIDMVINIGLLKNEQDMEVIEDISSVVNTVPVGIVVKVIIETCLLSDEEKIKACELAKRAGAHYVKTSTGFSSSGATVEDVKIMKKTVGEKLGVKASGGIRDLETAQKMIEAGATRIGASKSVEIVKSQSN
ncbi:deoxyribose-phosphate aldolase [Natranaerobius thermophilus]|uniref:Deoxyribose-phosphate aldolase n=1 Tax=Natranaerobius thermophilus (strain ATCC BAA-1301 / DSM 18059 / JW/NM-WN-LF) TaxID=457570 RepID=DEOC_NATTJ|nr:deoxyribose-phosphate aldolase [Natranaerobius thermophilus]B2A4J4.1 RecName: Full=Deoxyribose-phosphate aldolase; Short=DERA; AltName: Full=2-deoxy-D-ribose 5-phosphate aldolase; AltName: Full=Phosphodeoxyriboaldolase; Short=Deoxyriboaldolase [Natranaerobius thermophilus JW/NM-WN-LF]ACB85171.1 deoxyribose-phosphate aldolase [Natranaerobius thermophilus JW/NM-WN-LF]